MGVFAPLGHNLTDFEFETSICFCKRRIKMFESEKLQFTVNASLICYKILLCCEFIKTLI